ncbi:hypothetical protein ACFE04_013941 [Oxalis oulophora]
MCDCLGRNAGEDVESFYPTRPECLPDVPKTRFKARVGKTLSQRRWNAAFSPDGRLDMAKVLRRIQRGGVHPSIKGEVWEFLLGCYDFNTTHQDRQQLRQKRREQFEDWKSKCQFLVPIIGSGKFITSPIVSDDGGPIQDSHLNGDSNKKGNSNNDDASDNKVIQWKILLPQIGLDVVRTDQALIFYQTETNQARLWDILSVYAWVDYDIGYMQGMNDICSPMIILFENDADAYWCFNHAMRRVRENFRCSTTSIGVQTQLGVLSQVIKTIDPQLHKHLEDLDGGQYLFAFRMLMVLFRREFSFVDTMYIWELIWGMEYNPNMFSSYEDPEGATNKESAPVLNNKLYGKFERKNLTTGTQDQQYAFAVYVVASVLETKNQKLLSEAQGLDDVVQILGEITGNLDAKKACNEALKIHQKYLKKAAGPAGWDWPEELLVVAGQLGELGLLDRGERLGRVDRGWAVYVGQERTAEQGGFHNEKEPEMQIGNPTDVKHVAHIGWDGPSVNSAPSWMNEFQGQPGSQSAPLSANGDMLSQEFVADDMLFSRHKVANFYYGTDLKVIGNVPKSSRRQTSSTGESRERSGKPKQKKSTKSSSSKDVMGEGGRPARKPKDPTYSDSQGGPDATKKSHRKKPKDEGGSPRSRNRPRSMDENPVSNLNNEVRQSSGLNHFEDG